MNTFSNIFNGDFGLNSLGLTYPLDTNVHTWEIYYNNSKVYFTVGGELLHTLNANTTTWTDTLSLPIRIENSSGSGVSMNVRAATIYRLGNLLTQPTSYYHASGQTAGVNLKIGAGNIHSCTLLSMTNNAVVTLSDSLTTTTPVILATTATATTGVPLPIDLKGLPFFNGLRLTVSGANASVLVIYE